MMMLDAPPVQATPWQLRTADCLAPLDGMIDVLDDDAVDHVITDPPYSEHVHANLGREDRADGARKRGALGFECITEAVAGQVAKQLCRVTKRWILIFCDERAISMWAEAITDHGGEFVRGGVWVKTDGMPQMSGDRPAAGHESIVIAHAPRLKGSGRMRWNGGGRPATYTGPVRDGAERVHPTQKPDWLLERLIRDFTDPGELVLDPFAGSGTTGVAAVRLGRRFIGWERDAEHAERAIKRLSGAREQLQLAGVG